MGVIYLQRPQFLAMHQEDIKFTKYMFIKKGGKATAKIGDMTMRRCDAELICVSDEDKHNWIGNYAYGIGVCGVRFSKKDCRDATDEEVSAWLKDNDSVLFDK